MSQAAAIGIVVAVYLVIAVLTYALMIWDFQPKSDAVLCGIMWPSVLFFWALISLAEMLKRRKGNSKGQYR